jgi:hypothetical protein
MRGDADAIFFPRHWLKTSFYFPMTGMASAIFLISFLASRLGTLVFMNLLEGQQ